MRRSTGKILAVLLSLTTAISATAQNRQNEVKEMFDTLNTSRISADKAKRNDNSTQTGLIRLDSHTINPGFAVFGTPDVIKVLQALPGVATGTELMSGLYVHGGDGSDNLFLLDGVPLYQVSHFGGLFSSFNTDLIDNLDFYKSGFPARYGGRMSSVVDVSTKEGDMNEYHGSFSIGLIDGHLQMEGPIVPGKTSFNVGLRRSWMDLVTTPILWIVNNREDMRDEEKVKAGYQMYDFNLKLTHYFSEDSKLNFNFYNGRDKLKIWFSEKELDELYENGSKYIYDDDYNIIGENKLIESHSGWDKYGGSVAWGNQTASLRWDKKFSDKLESDITAFTTRSNSTILVSIDSWSWDWSQGKDTHYITEDTNISKIFDIGAKANLNWRPTSMHHVRFGTDIQSHSYAPNRNTLTEKQVSGKESNSASESEGMTFTGFEASLFAEDELALSNNFSCNFGLRGSIYSSPGKARLSLEPRAALKFQLSQDVSFKLSYAEMSQFSHLVSCTYVDLPTNCWMPSTSKIAPMKSKQLAGGIYTWLSPFVKLNVEGWYKTMEHMLEYAGTNVIFPSLTSWETDFSEGRGRSYGAEVELGYDNGKTNLTGYYTLSWSERNFPDFYYGWYRDRNDNRHKLTLMATRRFGKGFEGYASWNYHTGNRVTFASHVEVKDGYITTSDLFDQPNNTKLPDYHRLDLGLNFKKQTKKGNERTWNVSIYNVYNRMNAILAYLDVNGDEEVVGRAVGVVPIIPTVSYSIKF